MREGWEVKKFGEVCEELFAGGDVQKDRFSKTKTSKYNIPIFSNGEKDKGLYGYTDIARVMTPSITISARGTIGYSEKREVDYYPAIRLIVAIPKREVLNLDFLKHVISGIEFISNGTSIPQLTVPMIKGYDIPVPPLLEQQRIVSILDKAFMAIDQAKANTQKNLDNAKELFQSELNNIFCHSSTVSGEEEWVEKKLGEVIKYDKTPNKRNDLPYVGLENIESNSGKFLGTLDAQKVKSSTFYFTDKHVLYGRLRPYLNKVLLPEFDGHCSTEIFPILVCKELKREFLFHWLMSGKTVEKINETCTGARMPRANMNAVLDFTFNFPSLKTQQKIVSQLNTLSTETKKLETIYQQKLNKLEELKKSILDKAFKAELTEK